jgi:O-methyltransferase domain/Dimerisation domain
MSELPPESRLWNLERGALTTKALAIAADLGVADALAEGPRSVAQVAAETGADADLLRRILRALASDGVFVETQPGVFGNTDASELLREGAPGGWREFAQLFGGVFYTLDPRATEATFPRKFDTDFWSWLAENADERAAFDRAMAGGKERSAQRLADLDWRGDETVVDVGGGNGALLRALLELRPGLRGIVFDVPETERDEATLPERMTFVAGSFFERVPPGDAYVLSAILHDWDDESAAAILGTIRRAAAPQTRLLVIEAVVAEGNEPNGVKWLDLLLHVLAAGRERDETQWRELLDRAGFRIERLEDGLIEAVCR